LFLGPPVWWCTVSVCVGVSVLVCVCVCVCSDTLFSHSPVVNIIVDKG
jgi:hypothetical protein